MATPDIRPSGERPRSAASLAGAPIATAPYLVLDGSGDWTLSDTGPASGYFVTVGGDIEISAAASAHDRFFRKIGGDYLLR